MTDDGVGAGMRRTMMVAGAYHKISRMTDAVRFVKDHQLEMLKQVLTR